MINLLTPDTIKELLDESVLELYAKDAINEVKTKDHAHGKKLPHSILQNFFRQDAPKYDSLSAVETALAVLYKKNGIEFAPSGLKQVISNAKKHSQLKEDTLDEIALSSDEKLRKDKLVIKLKKNAKELRMRYKNKDESDIQLLAVSLAKHQ